MDLYDDQLSRPFVRHVRLRNYKSIAECDLELGRLNLIVGRNGAGKSNFLDAIGFVTDALRWQLDQAIRTRGGMDEVRRKQAGTGRPHNFSIEIELELAPTQIATYHVGIAARPPRGFLVKPEELTLRNTAGETSGHFKVTDGQVENGPQRALPLAAPDRLYLVAASSVAPFRSVFEALDAMRVYNLNPGRMRQTQAPDAGDRLSGDGENIAGVVARLASEKPEVLTRITEYLASIVPGIRSVSRRAHGPIETLEFGMKSSESEKEMKFTALNMSDGTLRALGVLVAAQQLTDRSKPMTLVGIEEPEVALHPAAAEALLDALRDAATHTQIVITTHSPDLLDFVRPSDDERLFVAEMQRGRTLIAEPDRATMNAIRDHLYTAGELLRMDQLQPRRQRRRSTDSEGSLFDEGDT